jgi:zinc/manganese transport system substrate-binding protein
MKRARLSVVAALAAILVIAGCSSGGSGTDEASAPTTAAAAGECPVEALDIVVTVNQWGDIVEQLAGDCGDVTTIISGDADVDPHEFEPSPSDAAAFEDAELVVMNGLDYDHWAEDAVASLSAEPAVINGGEVVGLEEGDNPHIWYGPDYVEQVADAITAELKALAPSAAAYFDAQAAAWDEQWQGLLDEVDAVRKVASAQSYAATEAVFAYMADAVGLVDDTPTGFAAAAANESDPSPGDVNAFEEALRGGEIDVLVYNTQTEGSIPEQVRGVAERASVPVVEVTESVPPGANGFVAWQVAQLEALATAVGG